MYNDRRAGIILKKPDSLQSAPSEFQRDVSAGWMCMGRMQGMELMHQRNGKRKVCVCVCVCACVCVVILGGYYTVKVEKGRQHITTN